MAKAVYTVEYKVASIIAVCASKKKGTKKEVLNKGILRAGYGLIGDAHANTESNRQVSLLALSSINKIRYLGGDVGPGDFAENLTIEGTELFTLPIGARLSVGKHAILEITQIGKECHDHCAIFKQVGTCIMPVEGVFTRVIKGGLVRVGDELKIIKKELP